MKKEKIILLILLILVIISGCKKKTEIDEGELYFKDYKVDTLATVNNCSSSNCPVIQKSTFVKVSASTNIKVINDALNKINEYQNSIYNKTKDSAITKGKTCGNYTNDIDYGYGLTGEYYIYEDDDLIIFGQKVTELDFCNDSYDSHQVENYIYDKQEQKMLTQEEFLNKVNISLDDVVNNINAYHELESIDQVVTKKDDIVVYRTDWGEYYASYFNTIENRYTSFSIGMGAN